MSDPDRPWLDEPVDKPVAAGTMVFRVRYAINAIEILELVARGPKRLLVKDPESDAPPTYIPYADCFNTFDLAKEALVKANTTAVENLEQDLLRARNKLETSQRMYLSED